MGVLRPEKMVKVGLLGLQSDEERILTVLHDLRVAQIEPLSTDAMKELAPERATDLQRRIADQALRFRGLLNALPKVGPPNPQRYDTVEALLEATKRIPIDGEVGELKREDDRLQTELKGLDETLQVLGRIAFYPDRLEYLRSPNFLAFFGEAKPEAFSGFRAALPNSADPQIILGPPGETVPFLVVLRTSGGDALSRAAQASGIRLVAVPHRSGTVKEETAQLTARRAEIVARRGQIADRLKAIATDWYPRIAAIDEALTIENRKYEATTRIGVGRETFALEAWVPQRDVARLEAILEQATMGRVYFYTVPTHEEAPTLMHNPGGIRRFEFFIRFYSLPQADEWDPTLVFAIVFPIFFGIMLGDWGFGLTILLICIWMIRGFPGAQHLPKSGRNFVKMIMGPKGMQQLAWALIPGCLIAMALGFAFDEFFGFHIAHFLFNTTAPADPLRNLGFLLEIAVFIGLAMVTFGFLLGALKEQFHHHHRAMLGKIGGIAFAWGFVGFGLTVVHYHTIAGLPLTPVLLASVAGLAAGIVLLFVGEGVQTAVMGLIEVVSHILSYTRLIGILLASVILAVVILAIAGIVAHPLGPVAGVVVGAIIVIVGGAFGVILGVFEPGIQGARLVFVEFFSKFYTGNGKPFRPFGAARTHTVSSIGPDGLASGPIIQAQPP